MKNENNLKASSIVMIAILFYYTGIVPSALCHSELCEIAEMPHEPVQEWGDPTVDYYKGLEAAQLTSSFTTGQSF